MSNDASDRKRQRLTILSRSRLMLLEVDYAVLRSSDGDVSDEDVSDRTGTRRPTVMYTQYQR
jgi:hypothetical protein